MTLEEIGEGAVAGVVRFHGGRRMIERLQSFGVHVGSTLRVLKAAPFRGPLLVEDLRSGARFMIGRGMASRIEIRHGRALGR